MIFRTKALCVIAVWFFIFSFFILTGNSPAKDKIVVGGKNFTEQYILAELAKDLLENNGFDVQLQTGVGSVVARRSLENDQIDMYYEYTGTAYTVYYKESDRDVMTDPAKVYEWVREEDAVKGLIWLDPLVFNNTYTLMMREKHAQKLGIASISDLSRFINEHPGELVVGVNAEFWERPDGFKQLMKTYGFRIGYNEVKKMDSGLVYKALLDKNVDVSMGFATDGRIDAFGFMVLKDDKSFFPVYSPAPVIRKEVLDQHPEIREILSVLTDKLTTEEMRDMNSAVDVKHRDIGAVAMEWLKNKGIINP